MPDPESPDYTSLLERAGARHLSEEDIADLRTGLGAIDRKIAFLRTLAAELDGVMPEPVTGGDGADA